MEAVRAQNLFETPVEALDHAVGPGPAWFDEAKVNVQRLTQRIELVLARFTAGARAGQSIGELLAVVGKDRLYPDRATAPSVFRKALAAAD